jgi:hypothetical protein
MPDFPLPAVAPRRTARSFTVSMLAAGGDEASVQIADIPVTTSGSELADVRLGVGTLTNAAVIKTTVSETVEISPTRANPLDEAYASASTKLIITFQNQNLEIRSLAIPAPDESYFGPDGVTMIAPDISAAPGSPARVLAYAIDAIANAINGGVNGTGTFQLLNGFRSERTRKLSKPKTVRPSVEPTATTEPGPEPDAG